MTASELGHYVNQTDEEKFIVQDVVEETFPKDAEELEQQLEVQKIVDKQETTIGNREVIQEEVKATEELQNNQKLEEDSLVKTTSIQQEIIQDESQLKEIYIRKVKMADRQTSTTTLDEYTRNCQNEVNNIRDKFNFIKGLNQI